MVLKLQTMKSFGSSDLLYTYFNPSIILRTSSTSLFFILQHPKQESWRRLWLCLVLIRHMSQIQPLIQLLPPLIQYRLLIRLPSDPIPDAYPDQMPDQVQNAGQNPESDTTSSSDPKGIADPTATSSPTPSSNPTPTLANPFATSKSNSGQPLDMERAQRRRCKICFNIAI